MYILYIIHVLTIFRKLVMVESKTKNCKNLESLDNGKTIKGYIRPLAYKIYFFSSKRFYRMSCTITQSNPRRKK